MATRKQIRYKADTKLSEFWSVLTMKQDTYFAKHGKYFQLLVTNRVIDGVDFSFETRTPFDEKNPQDADLTFQSKIPFQIQVDEWVDKDDAGYSATVFIEMLSGDIYTRTRTNLNADSGWSLYIEEPNYL